MPNAGNQEILHYADDSDSPAWTIEMNNGTPGRWTRNIEGIDGDLAAINDSQNGATLQLTNLHGDIVATASLSTTATGPLQTFEADEFGSPRQPSSRRYGWLGGKQRRTELASGVIQMGRRSYVPAMGRFTSVDPVERGSANSYEYGYQDPVNNFDLTGCQSTFRCIMACVSAYCNFNRVIRSCSESIALGSLRGLAGCIIGACAEAGDCIVRCLKRPKRKTRRRPPGGGGGGGGIEILPISP